MRSGFHRVAFAAVLLVAAPAWPVAAAEPSAGPTLSAGAEITARDRAIDAVPGIDAPLAAAAQQVLDSHPEISAAQRRTVAARYDTAAARWLRFPSVSVQAVTRTDRVGLSPELEVFQPIWSGGRIARTIDRSRAAERVADNRVGEVALDLLIRLSNAYYEIARTVRLSDVYRQSIEEHERLVGSMERRVAQEVSPRSDLELARARVAQVIQDKAVTDAQHQAALRRFYQLIGHDDFAFGPVPEYSPLWHHLVDQESVARAAACSPSVRRLSAEVDLAEAERRLTRSQILPQLGAQYSYDRFRGSQVGLALRAQTGGGLSPLAAAEAAGARLEASGYALESAKREAEEAVSLDLVVNRAAQDRALSAGDAVSATANVTESFLRQFVAGRRTWLDVMNSVREATAAKAQLIELETDAMASSARIHLRACDWQPPEPAA